MTKIDWGSAPAEIDVEPPYFDLKAVMEKCYPFHPVHLRHRGLVFELQLVAWPDDENHRRQFAEPPVPAMRLRTREEIEAELDISPKAKKPR